MYTTDFPKTLFNNRLITNITSRVNTLNVFDLNNFLHFEPYLIKDGETPESISFDFYKSTKYWWVILLINHIDFNEEYWPMSSQYLETFIENKYGKSKYFPKYYIRETGDKNQNITMKSFKDDEGNIIDFYEQGEENGTERGNFIIHRGKPVSFENYEIELNEKRRNIKILKPEYLDSFINEFKIKIRD